MCVVCPPLLLATCQHKTAAQRPTAAQGPTEPWWAALPRPCLSEAAAAPQPESPRTALHGGAAAAADAVTGACLARHGEGSRDAQSVAQAAKSARAAVDSRPAMQPRSCGRSPDSDRTPGTQHLLMSYAHRRPAAPMLQSARWPSTASATSPAPASSAEAGKGCASWPSLRLAAEAKGVKVMLGAAALPGPASRRAGGGGGGEVHLHAGGLHQQVWRRQL